MRNEYPKVLDTYGTMEYWCYILLEWELKQIIYSISEMCVKRNLITGE